MTAGRLCRLRLSRPEGRGLPRDWSTQLIFVTWGFWRVNACLAYLPVPRRCEPCESVKSHSDYEYLSSATNALFWSRGIELEKRRNYLAQGKFPLTM